MWYPTVLCSCTGLLTTSEHNQTVFSFAHAFQLPLFRLLFFYQLRLCRMLPWSIGDRFFRPAPVWQFHPMPGNVACSSQACSAMADFSTSPCLVAVWCSFRRTPKVSDVLLSTATWDPVLYSCPAQHWVRVFHPGELLPESGDCDEHSPDFVSPACIQLRITASPLVTFEQKILYMC